MMLSSQANIFKSDFLEERRDREKAKGDLDTVKREMWHKDAMFQQEMTGLTETINVMKQEHKRELVRVEAKYQERISTSKVTVQALKSKVQEICRESNDWKNDAQQKKKAMVDKSKEVAKLKAQVKLSIL